jgi:hypothetical protein
MSNYNILVARLDISFLVSCTSSLAPLDVVETTIYLQLTHIITMDFTLVTVTVNEGAMV